MALRATLDLRASATSPDSDTGRLEPALHDAQRPNRSTPRPRSIASTGWDQADLVNRNFTATEPNQLRITDITEHPTGSVCRFMLLSAPRGIRRCP